jgi:hypothetical protein
MTAPIMKMTARMALQLIAVIAVCTAGAVLAASNLLASGHFFAAGGDSASEESAARPVELGAVAWGRDFDAAVREAHKTGKPLLVLFQEVPG